MKKSFICGLFIALLASVAVFAEPMTKSAVYSNTEKFLTGKGTYIKASLVRENNNITVYIPRQSVKNIEIRENKGVSFIFITADIYIYDEHVPCVGFGNIKKDDIDGKSLATPANDISIDELGNLVIQKK